MALVPTISEREELAEDSRHLADRIIESRGRIGPVWGAIIQSPQVADRLAHLGTYLQFESVLTNGERQLAMIVAAAHWNCELELRGHSRAAEAAGVSPVAIEAVTARSGLDDVPDAEALVIRFSRELLENTGFVSDVTFAATHARYGDQGIVDLIATLGYMSNVACLINGLRITV